MVSKGRGYLLSPLAERDLEDIWIYTFDTWSQDQADSYHSTLIDALGLLASGEKIGRDAGDIRAGYKKLSVGRHVLFYRDNDENIIVIRILHQSMDIPTHLGSVEDS